MNLEEQRSAPIYEELERFRTQRQRTGSDWKLFRDRRPHSYEKISGK